MARVLQLRRVIIGATIAAFAAVGCTIQDTKAPALQGPSEMSLAFTLSAVPDVLAQDGASQSQITIQARDANGQPARSVTFRIDMSVNGLLADFGSLSARTLVTGTDGRATVTYTTPQSVTGGVDTGQVVTILVTPFGTDFGNSLSRAVNIRLIPPGVLLPGGPTPKFTVTPAAPTAFSDVKFDASTSVPAPSTLLTSYSWNFGDGGTGSGVVAFHRFAAGSFVVTLTVTDTNGVSASAPQTLTVGAGTPPTANFVFSPAAPAIHQDILFNASTSTAGTGRSIVRYDWDFGSGVQRSGVTVTKAYDTPGTYTVVLTVTDDVGQTGTSTKNVLVTATSAVLIADFTVSPTAPHTGNTVFFNASLSSPQSQISTYAWDWGDGSAVCGPVSGAASVGNCGAGGTGFTPNHVFPAVAGGRTWKVTLTITNTSGQTARKDRDVAILDP